MRLDGHGWQSMSENTGRYLEDFSPPMVWSFTWGTSIVRRDAARKGSIDQTDFD